MGLCMKRMVRMTISKYYDCVALALAVTLALTPILTLTLTPTLRIGCG
jgi:hypothetical protein